MLKFPKAKDLIVDGEIILNEDNLEALMNLISVVINKHYSFLSLPDKEEMSQVGITKCIEILRKGDFDDERSSLKNYLYTAIRNEITNTLYRAGKELPQEENRDSSEALPQMTEISEKMVLEVVPDKYLRQVMSGLYRLGFPCRNYNEKSCYKSDKYLILFINYYRKNYVQL